MTTQRSRSASLRYSYSQAFAPTNKLAAQFKEVRDLFLAAHGRAPGSGKKFVLGHSDRGNVTNPDKMNKVRLAYDQQSERMVAVKSVVNVKEGKCPEVDVMIRVDHPNVIKVYDTVDVRRQKGGKTKYKTFIVMEVGGLSLKTLGGAGKRYSEKDAARILWGVFQGILSCDAADVILLDLHAGNLLMNDDLDACKIIDFDRAVDRRDTAWIERNMMWSVPERRCNVLSKGFLSIASYLFTEANQGLCSKHAEDFSLLALHPTDFEANVARIISHPFFEQFKPTNYRSTL